MRCMQDKEKVRGYCKVAGSSKPQRWGALLVIRWESPYDYFILDNHAHYQWYEQKDILLNDGCKYQVLDIEE